ncbi:hypothetical protein MTO96_035269 [Rhipicephalus appendiculatus]
MCLVMSNATSDSVNLSFKLYVLTDGSSAKSLEGGDQKMAFRLGSTDKAATAFVEATSLQQIIQQEHLRLQSTAFPRGEMNYRVS